MTAGTIRGRADECRHRLSQHVVSIEVIERDRPGRIGAVVKGPRPQESQGRNQMAGLRLELIDSQLLADEVWEEEVEYAREKEKAISSSKFKEWDIALDDADAQELQETEEILSASADSRHGSEKLDGRASDVPPKFYDQTQLDGKTDRRSPLVLLLLPPDPSLTSNLTTQAFHSYLVFLLMSYLKSLDMKSLLFQTQISQASTSYGARPDCPLLPRNSLLLFHMSFLLTRNLHLMEFLSFGAKNFRTKLKNCCLVLLRVACEVLTRTVFDEGNPG